MNETEAAYTEAFLRIQQALHQFHQHASIEAYLDCRSRIIAEHIQSRFPEVQFILEPVHTTKLTHTLMQVNFYVDLRLMICSQIVAKDITDELCDYLDSLNTIEASIVKRS